MEVQDERKPGFLIARFSVTGDHSFKGRWTRGADSSSPSGVCWELPVVCAGWTDSCSRAHVPIVPLPSVGTRIRWRASHAGGGPSSELDQPELMWAQPGWPMAAARRVAPPLRRPLCHVRCHHLRPLLSWPQWLSQGRGFTPGVGIGG